MILECTAITEYLNSQDGKPVVTGRTAKECAAMHMMQRRTEAGLLDAAGAYFHHAAAGPGPDIETYRNGDWGRKQGERAVATMRTLDGELAGRACRACMGDDEFTMADLSAMPGLFYSDFAKIETPPELPHLAAWCARVNARPRVAATA